MKDIIFEFSPQSDGKMRGVIIVCDGLPSMPKQKELISYLASRGFFVIFPRYRGTWESGGEFLKASPTKDIEEVINLLKQGKITELYAGRTFDVKKEKVYLIGSSFGGTVALSLLNNRSVSKIVALSPIVNIKRHNDKKKEQDLVWLGGFIKRAFGEGYRFNDKNWEKMILGEIFNPPQKIAPKRAKDILILYDKSDSEIDYRKIEDYALKNGIEIIAWENIGHLSFSKLPKEAWNKIIDWLNAPS